MSFRNIFVIHCGKQIVGHFVSDIQKKINEYGLGFRFQPKNYQDELISKIRDCHMYFSITSSECLDECDELFSLENAFFKSLSYPKKEQEIKEQEFLQEQFRFMDSIIDVIFSYSFVKYIEVFVSDQVSNCIEDYYEVVMDDRCLSKCLASVYRPRGKEKYIGFKTTKFVIK